MNIVVFPSKHEANLWIYCPSDETDNRKGFDGSRRALDRHLAGIAESIEYRGAEDLPPTWSDRFFVAPVGSFLRWGGVDMRGSAYLKVTAAFDAFPTGTELRVETKARPESTDSVLVATADRVMCVRLLKYDEEEEDFADVELHDRRLVRAAEFFASGARVIGTVLSYRVPGFADVMLAGPTARREQMRRKADSKAKTPFAWFEELPCPSNA